MDDDDLYIDVEDDTTATLGDDTGSWGAWEAGTAFALLGYLGDRYTDKVTEAIGRQGQGGGQPPHIEVHVHPEEDPPPKLINAAEGKGTPGGWQSFIGQEPLKLQLQTHIASAKARDVALDHTLLASGAPGTGKTSLARIIAEEMGSQIIMLVPPFHKETLYEAAMALPDKGTIFLDEVHRLVEHGRGPAENLLHLLEERRLYLDEGVVKLNDITVIGATTDPDKLPETIIDRFPIKPYIQPYSFEELAEITARFEGLEHITLPFDTTVGIARACRGVPRVARELVVGARDLYHATGKVPDIAELLRFKEVDPDGMTRQHKAYITHMFQHFQRTTATGEVQYVAGEAAMMNVLRETRQGIGRLERFLMERGLLDRTPSGRRLTERGIAAAQRYLAERQHAA